MTPFEAIRHIVQIRIQEDETLEERTAHIARDKEADGYRIVGGGQVNQDQWEVTDWRTEEIIAEGWGLESYEELFQQNRWWHIDAISHQVYDEWLQSHKTPEGIPDGLAEALMDWASNDPVEAELWLESTN